MTAQPTPAGIGETMPEMTHAEISAAVNALEHARRKAMVEVMREYDERSYWPGMKPLREACAKLGHKWRFTHLGPLSDPWFSCGVCHAAECRREEKGTTP